MDRDSRLPSLTGLRWAAALIVFGQHLLEQYYNPQLVAAKPVRTAVWAVLAHGGGLGVSFFFVLSGFVLTWSARPGERTGAFYWRRFSKVYPATLVTTLAAVVIIGGAGPLQLGTHLTLTQSWLPRPDVYTALNLVSWSLSCEVFFYLCFPLLLAGMRRLGPAGLWAIAAMMIECVALLAVILVRTPHTTATWVGYVLPPVRMAEFTLGIAVALLVRRGAWRGPGLRWSLALLPPACVAALFTPYPVHEHAVTLIPVTLIVAAAAQADLRGIRTLWSRPLAVYLGQLSFAFYLVHFLVISAFDRYGLLPHQVGIPQALVATVSVFWFSVIAAMTVYHGVELPALRLLRRAAPAKVVPAGRHRLALTAAPALRYVGAVRMPRHSSLFDLPTMLLPLVDAAPAPQPTVPTPRRATTPHHDVPSLQDDGYDHLTTTTPLDIMSSFTDTDPFERASFSGTSFDRASFDGASFDGASFDGASLNGADAFDGEDAFDSVGVSDGPVSFDSASLFSDTDPLGDFALPATVPAHPIPTPRHADSAPADDAPEPTHKAAAPPPVVPAPRHAAPATAHAASEPAHTDLVSAHTDPVSTDAALESAYAVADLPPVVPAPRHAAAATAHATPEPAHTDLVSTYTDLGFAYSALEPADAAIGSALESAYAAAAEPPPVVPAPRHAAPEHLDPAPAYADPAPRTATRPPAHAALPDRLPDPVPGPAPDPALGVPAPRHAAPAHAAPAPADDILTTTRTAPEPAGPPPAPTHSVALPRHAAPRHATPLSTHNDPTRFHRPTVPSPGVPAPRHAAPAHAATTDTPALTDPTPAPGTPAHDNQRPRPATPRHKRWSTPGNGPYAP